MGCLHNLTLTFSDFDYCCSYDRNDHDEDHECGIGDEKGYFQSFCHCFHVNLLFLRQGSEC